MGSREPLGYARAGGGSLNGRCGGRERVAVEEFVKTGLGLMMRGGCVAGYGL